ncbi:MAG: ATP-binding protein [Peptococcaceae bacterium]|nr:ATP-binding protein [Peptococcaceae bacterium]
MNEIWQPYKKADASRNNTKGTGLGLAISRAILELYQFSYGVQNSDNGVKFWFKFT